MQQLNQQHTPLFLMMLSPTYLPYIAYDLIQYGKADPHHVFDYMHNTLYSINLRHNEKIKQKVTFLCPVIAVLLKSYIPL